MNYKLTPVTQNKKLGMMATSISNRGTCPDTCSLKDECYGNGGPMNIHWGNVSSGKTGSNWGDFCENVRKLPKGWTFRHDQVGDLPGENCNIDSPALLRLVTSASHLKAYTYTHKPVLKSVADNFKVDYSTLAANRSVIGLCNDAGFTINLSCDSLDQVDEAKELNIAPITVVLPTDAPEKQFTKGGHKVIVCPAQTKGLTCSQCMLCAKQRSVVVGFRAHGMRKNKLTKKLTAAN